MTMYSFIPSFPTKGQPDCHSTTEMKNSVVPEIHLGGAVATSPSEHEFVTSFSVSYSSWSLSQARVGIQVLLIHLLIILFFCQLQNCIKFRSDFGQALGMGKVPFDLLGPQNCR